MNTELTENRVFDLRRVSFEYYDYDYAYWRTIGETFIITERGNYDTYLGSSSVFEEYTESVKEWKSFSWNANRNLSDSHKINIDHLTSVDSIEDLEHLKRLFNVEGESKYLKTTYQIVQHYGGSEEGGWYYHNRYLVGDVDADQIGTDRYGEGYDIYSEFYLGQNEKTGSEHYC